MALLLLSSAPSRAAYDSVTATLGDHRAPGHRVHVASELDDGTVRIVDVWESQAAFDAFSGRIMPAFVAAGLSPAQLGEPPVPTHTIEFWS